MTTTADDVLHLPIGARIVWARKRKGISQEKLAELIGTSRRHMIRLEKGYNQPGKAFVARIAEATEQPEDLFAADVQEAAAASGEPFRGGPRSAPDADGAGDGRAGRRATDRVTEGEAA